MGGVLRGAVVVLTGLLALCACTTVQLDFQALPPAEAFLSLRPGVTTRDEVLHRLGPPDELRRPSNFDRARFITPQHRRVLEGGRLFDARTWTWATGVRRSRSFQIVPGGPALFGISRTESLEERWRVEFDAAGVVESVSHVDEIGAAG